MECFAVFKVREHWNLKFQEACPSQAPGTVLLPCGLSPRAVSQSPSDANHWPLRSCAAAHCVCLLGGLWQAQTPRRSRVWHPPEEGRQGCTLTACRRGLRTAFDWWPIRPGHPKWASLKWWFSSFARETKTECRAPDAWPSASGWGPVCPPRLRHRGLSWSAVCVGCALWVAVRQVLSRTSFAPDSTGCWHKTGLHQSRVAALKSSPVRCSPAAALRCGLRFPP